MDEQAIDDDYDTEIAEWCGHITGEGEVRNPLWESVWNALRNEGACYGYEEEPERGLQPRSTRSINGSCHREEYSVGGQVRDAVIALQQSGDFTEEQVKAVAHLCKLVALAGRINE